MKTTTISTLCARCDASAPLLGIDCRECHYAALVMLYVHKHWHPGELEKLRDVLRGKPVSELIRNNPVGATLSLKIYKLIRSLSHPAKIHEDTLKMRVCNEITKYMASLENIRKYEAKNGEGSYMKAWIAKLGTILKGGEVSA